MISSEVSVEITSPTRSLSRQGILFRSFRSKAEHLWDRIMPKRLRGIDLPSRSYSLPQDQDARRRRVDDCPQRPSTVDEVRADTSKANLDLHPTSLSSTVHSKAEGQPYASKQEEQLPEASGSAEMISISRDTFASIVHFVTLDRSLKLLQASHRITVDELTEWNHQIGWIRNYTEGMIDHLQRSASDRTDDEVRRDIEEYQLRVEKLTACMIFVNTQRRELGDAMVEFEGQHEQARQSLIRAVTKVAVQSVDEVPLAIKHKAFETAAPLRKEELEEFEADCWRFLDDQDRRDAEERCGSDAEEGCGSDAEDDADEPIGWNLEPTLQRPGNNWNRKFQRLMQAKRSLEAVLAQEGGIDLRCASSLPERSSTVSSHVRNYHQVIERAREALKEAVKDARDVDIRCTDNGSFVASSCAESRDADTVEEELSPDAVSDWLAATAARVAKWLDTLSDADVAHDDNTPPVINDDFVSAIPNSESVAPKDAATGSVHDWGHMYPVNSNKSLRIQDWNETQDEIRECMLAMIDDDKSTMPDWHDWCQTQSNKFEPEEPVNIDSEVAREVE